MKIIKPEDFPIKMTFENINIMAYMSLILPPLLDFSMILPLLTYDEKIYIYNRASEIKEEKERKRRQSLTPEEQEEEKQSRARSLNEGPTVYRGNILQQEWDSMNLERIEKEKKEVQKIKK